MKRYSIIAILVVISLAVTAQTLEARDLGLSVDWAYTNLGASKPYEAGGYYGWADPTGLETSTDVFDSSRNWVSDLYGGPQPPSSISGTSLDIAKDQLGDGWRLPTLDELQELMNCRHRWMKYNNVSGYMFTGPNGNNIFLPAAGCRDGEEMYYVGAVGYYWTGTLGTDPNMHGQRAHRLYIGAEGINSNPAVRYSGFCVRPVKEKNSSAVSVVMEDVSDADNRIFDLAGRQLNSKPDKGFYIQNGKKYLVR